MMTVATISGLILMLGIGFWWAVRIGKKMNEADRFEDYKETSNKINTFNKNEDEALEKHSSSGGITSPWLRKRK